MQFNLRDRFAMPFGRAPGVNPNHILARSGPIRFSGVAASGGGGFIGLLNGARGSISGAPTTKFIGGMGPSAGFGGGGTDGVSFSGLAAASDTAITFACIFQITATSVFGGYLTSAGAANKGCYIAFNSGAKVQFNIANGGSANTVMPFIGGADWILNNPYFIAACVSASTQAIAVVDLTKQQLTTATNSSGLTIAASDGTYLVGNEPGTAANGYLAAGAMIAGTHTIQTLALACDDPWSFWYPDRLTEVGNELRL